LLGYSGRTVTYSDQSTTHYIWTADVGSGAPIFPVVTLYFASTDCSGTPYSIAGPIGRGDNTPPQLLVATKAFDGSAGFNYYARDASHPAAEVIDSHSQLTTACATVTQLGIAGGRMLVVGQMLDLAVGPVTPITFR